MSDSHPDPATASTGQPEAASDGRPFIPPAIGRWPVHWQVPTIADLEHVESGYRRGLAPAHAPLLHEPVPPLAIGSPDAKQVAERLYEAARREADAAQGQMVGLAAPQVGIPARACLFDPRQEPTREKLPVEQLRCIINPQVEPVGDDLIREIEGCLSTGPIKGWVQRAARVRLRGYTPDGELIEEEHTGLAARVIQHETDHLNGIVFPQRIDDDYDLLWASAEQVNQFRVRAGVPAWRETPLEDPHSPRPMGRHPRRADGLRQPRRPTGPGRSGDQAVTGMPSVGDQTTPLRHGYTMADLDVLTRKAALGSRWRFIDFDERADVARFAIVEYLLTATEPPGFWELVSGLSVFMWRRWSIGAGSI